MENNEIFTQAFNELFKAIQETEINIFLCGKSVSSEDSIRSELQVFLEKYPRINVIYPEWLFSNILEKKGNDLLTLENILATDVDKIILPLEGPGSFCELGSFVMRDEVINKLYVLNEKAYEHDSSFVNKGPLRLIKKSKTGQVFYIDNTNHQEVLKSIEDRIKYGKYDRSKRSIVNIFSLATFLGILIGLFQPIKRKYLENGIKEWDAQVDVKMIDPCLELLINKGFLVSKPLSHDNEVLSLTPKGYDYYYNNVLSFRTKQRVFSRLRAISLWTKNKSSCKFNFDLAKSRLLDLQQ